MFSTDIPERARKFIAEYKETPIYNALVKEFEERRKAERDSKIFMSKAVEYSREPFDVRQEEFVKIRQALLGALYETVANVQPTVHGTFHEEANAFNSGVEYTAGIIEMIFNKVKWED